MQTSPENKVNKYQRLIERGRELRERGKRLWDSGNYEDHAYLAEMDCLDHFFEAGGVPRYEKIASFCKEKGFDRVVDIGCAHGHQSEIFFNEGLSYLGVDGGDHVFWNGDQFPFVVGKYPCELPVQKGDLAVSVLCLTWNCYLHESEKTLAEQCEALAKQFEHCLLYLGCDPDFVSGYFKRGEFLGDRFWYFTNK